VRTCYVECIALAGWVAPGWFEGSEEEQTGQLLEPWM
jgi:hypothetical protein